MQQQGTREQVEVPSTASARRVATDRAGPGRIVSIDLLRGLVMALMALDHTRDFFGASGFNPRDVTEPALFSPAGSRSFARPPSFFSPGFQLFFTAAGGALKSSAASS
jgi:uncharacterized membrane protein